MSANHSELFLPEFQPKQQLFFDSPATEILYGGDTRGGKTAATKLMLIHLCSMIPGLQCDIWRLREEDVIGNYMEGDFGFPVLLSQWIKDKIVTCNRSEVRFSNGSLIELSNCWTDAAMSKAQGIPKHVRVIDEAGQIPERRLKWLKLWMTMSQAQREKIPVEWRDRLPKLIYLTNRIGQSKNFLKRTFVRARPKYAIEQVGAFKQQYIPSAVRDNPMEDPEATIARITEGADAATAKALLSEDGWDAQTGNYFETWDSERHVVKAFPIDDYWVRFRTYDYGSYEPWCCLWVAISPGVTIHKGTIHERYLPRGCKVVYREWYGCKAEHPIEQPGTDAYEKELNCTNLAPKGWGHQQMAEGIVDRTEKKFDNQPTFTDGFPFIKLGGKCIADDFKKYGVVLTHGKTNRENRGAETISALNGVKLLADSDQTWPMLAVFEDCKYIQDYMPMIERHPKEGREWDYAENGEATHVCFTGDTLVKTNEGDKRIDSLKVGDFVLAGDGEYRPISAAGLTRKNAELIELRFSDGSTVICTPDHKILTTNGWIEACDSVNLAAITGGCESKSYQKLFKSLTAEPTSSIRVVFILVALGIGCIELFGNIITERLQKVYTSTTKTVIDSTTKLRIWSLSLLSNILINIGPQNDPIIAQSGWIRLGILPKNGIEAQKDSTGISNITLKTALVKCTSLKTLSANIAAKSFNQLKLKLNIVRAGVRKEKPLKIKAFTLMQSVSFVKQILRLQNIDLQKPVAQVALLSCAGKMVISKTVTKNADVYCLTEPVTHSFQLSSRLVVSNCDCVTLACVTHDVIADAPEDSEVTIKKAIADPRNTRQTIKDLAPGVF